MSWTKVEMDNKTVDDFSQPRTKNRIRAVAQLVSQFYQQHGRAAFFNFKSKSDTVFKSQHFFFQRGNLPQIRCRSKHELLSMPYIFSDVNFSSKACYKLLVADFYSEKAIKIIDAILDHGPNSQLEKQLVFEHVKPCNIIREQLAKLGEVDEDEINAFLEKQIFVAVLTREENKEVNATRENGVSCLRNMPDRAVFFSRYLSANKSRNAGIVLFVPSEKHRSLLIQAQFPKLNLK